MIPAFLYHPTNYPNHYQLNPSLIKVKYLSSLAYSMDLEEIPIKPIGIVKSPFTEHFGESRRTTVAQVVINREHSQALDGLSEYSHIIIIFWMHKMTHYQKNILQIHPRGREDLPVVGVLASRGKTRPNPIGLAVVELLDVKDNILTVKGLDAYNDSPVLDVKPYDHYDVKNDIKVPSWWTKISQTHSKK